MNPTTKADTVDSTEETTLDLLAQLCERQRELTAPAHVAVMDAFNRLADGVPSPPLFCYSAPTGNVAELLKRADNSLEHLAADEADLGRCLLYGEVRGLLNLAAAES